MSLLWQAWGHRVRSTVAVGVLVSFTGLGVAQTSPLVLLDTTAPQAPAPTLPEVTVKEPALKKMPELVMDPVLSRTTVDAQHMARRQASQVFELLDEIPGVSVNGGPRASGMSFNIRGYSDNEDIAVQIDGVNKGFEKYRFGGTFIEPDLLKTLEVRRGAQIESGAGALGGTVIATTKDAADLLRPGQRLGARARLGWASNNNEQHRHVSVYGRPSDHLDLVAAWSTRVGGDITLPDGQALALSSVDMGSHLLKATWFTGDDSSLSASWLRYHDQGLQAYDATGGQPGQFGDVQRRIHDDTLALRWQWLDPSGEHDWQATLGQARTRVQDHFEPGINSPIFANANTGAVDDDVDMTGLTLELKGRWRFLRMGMQAGQQDRASLRRQALNPGRYPGGYNEAQPPGGKTNLGLYVQPQWHVGRWQVLPGLRWDQVSSRVIGPSADLLRASGQPAEVHYQHLAPSLQLVHDLVPGRWQVFASRASAFRPPLLDELFSRGPYGNCNTPRLTRGYTVPGYHSTPGVSNQVAAAPASGLCSGHYGLEVSDTTEWGVSTRQPGVWGDRSELKAKLTLFRNHTEHLLESLMAVPNAPGVLYQPGWERRHGLELEASLEGPRGFARASYSQVKGRLYDGEVLMPLTTVPGDHLSMSLGWRWRDLEAVLRWQRVGQRLVADGLRDEQQRDILSTQASYRVLGMSLNWQINPFLDLALSGENLENASYRLNSGFGNSTGTQAPGRNLRLSLSGRY